MNEQVLFRESANAFNLVMMGIIGFLILFSIFFAVWTFILSYFPKARKKMFFDFEWEKAPYQAGFLLLVLAPVCAAGFWWGATRVSEVRLIDHHSLVLNGIFGNQLARLESTDIEKIEVDGATHKSYSTKTYKIEIFAKGKSHTTFSLLWKEMDSLRTKLLLFQNPKSGKEESLLNTLRARLSSPTH